MVKKRKASGKSAQGGPRDYDPKDARLGPISTYADVADSEDEYFLHQAKEQDHILFDDGPKSKKQRRLEDEEDFLEPSDEEILDYDQDSEVDDDEDEVQPAPKSKQKTIQRKGDDAEHDDEDAEQDGQGGEDSGWWGSSRKDYYNNDQIETEMDAQEEEQEALRLQKKKLEKMAEEDFFNEDAWLDDEPQEEAEGEIVTEVLQDLEIPEGMSPDECLRLLQTRYPELDHLAEELLELQPLLVSLQQEAESQTTKSLPVVKYRILGCYVAALAMYFATLTAPARDGAGEAKTLDPAELREHEVMGTLLECREAWKQVKDLKSSRTTTLSRPLISQPDENIASEPGSVEEALVSTKQNRAADKKKAKEAKRAAAVEESLADLSGLLDNARKTSKVKKARPDVVHDDHSDFGEEETLNVRDAADKAARKKSLRFYTSQIVQKANKRSGAGRDAGGDMDIPIKERLKDRQARLNAQAEKRGQKDGKGADLGDDASDEEDMAAAKAVREDNDDEYYDLVAARSSKKKGDKAAKSAALAEASALDRVVETEVVGEDGKRKITYAIEKNKGLVPRRKKDVRNPRVKKRKKYEDKKKKLKSMKAVYSGGEGRGGYGGELTGIKSGLVKSVKL